MASWSIPNPSHKSYLESLPPKRADAFQYKGVSKENDISMKDVMARTPDDHYAKYHPGAGWAGYKHPMCGGYLDHLSSPFVSPSPSSQEEKSITIPNHDGSSLSTMDFRSSSLSYLATLRENSWEEGKSSDYGDDVRWGSQVYLDAL